MKRILAIAVAASVAALTQAATVGWSAGNIGTDYNGDAYQVFVIGQKNVTSIKQITDLLDAGSSVASYAFGEGTVASGRVNASAGDPGQPTLGEGTYTSFMVMFDSASPSSGDSNYVVFSGGANQTKTVGPNTSTVTFGAGNVSSTVSNSDNWKSYGTPTPPPGPDDPDPGIVPEPTTVALLALGLAAFGLKRKIA